MLIGVAYLLGTQSAGLLDKWNMGRNAEEYRSKAAAQPAAILRKMGTIKVGDTLSNFAFEDIDGELHLLNEILTNKTLITYMKPDCDGCLVELERLRAAANSPEDYEQVLIISSANPLHLRELREDYGLGCLMLYDEERFFGMALEIYTYPFNLVVNSDRVILEIYGSVLLPDDYESLFSITGEPVEGWLTSGAPTLASGVDSALGSPALSVIPAPFVIPAPYVIPAPSVIPEQSGIQMSCDKALSSTHSFASSKRQLDPRFREGDATPGHERFDTRQMWTSVGHVLVT